MEAFDYIIISGLLGGRGCFRALLLNVFGGLESNVCLEIDHEADETDKETVEERGIGETFADVVDTLSRNSQEDIDGDETNHFMISTTNTPIVGHD